MGYIPPQRPYDPDSEETPVDTDNYGCFFTILLIAIIFIGCFILSD